MTALGLDHVLWVGGGSGARKSTLARCLAERHGLRVYDTDAAMGEHVHRASARQAPRLQEFLAMDSDARWLHRGPQEMLETFHWFQGEAFELILEDLADMGEQTRVVAEGFRLLPQLVAPLLGARARALWLLPTPQARRRALESRGSTWTIAGTTSDPQRALENLLERDALFTERLRGQVDALGLYSVDVDAATSVADVLTLAEKHFHL